MLIELLEPKEVASTLILKKASDDFLTTGVLILDTLTYYS